MNFNVDVTARQFLVGRNALTTLGSGVVHQNDQFTISVWFTEQTGIASGCSARAAAGSSRAPHSPIHGPMPVRFSCDKS